MVTTTLAILPTQWIRRAETRGIAIGLLTLALCVAHAAGTLRHGWVPHDLGQLGQTAERVVHGELPHRDFDEPYTGGLSFLNALAFILLGLRSESIRWMLLFYFALFVAAVFWLAWRVVPPGIATMVTVLCAALSIPIYPEGLPSWYGLFFAVFAVAALVQHIETGRSKWIFWAGCCVGCSLLMKITGIYLLAACLLYIVMHEQSRAPDTPPPPQHGRAFSMALSMALAAFALLSAVFLRSARPLSNAVHFVLPIVVLVTYLLWSEWQAKREVFHRRLQRYVVLLTPLLLGIVCVLVPFLIPYTTGHALHDLFRGVFILPSRRLTTAALPPPQLNWMVCALPVAAVLAIEAMRPTRCLGTRRPSPRPSPTSSPGNGQGSARGGRRRPHPSLLPEGEGAEGKDVATRSWRRGLALSPWPSPSGRGRKTSRGAVGFLGFGTKPRPHWRGAGAFAAVALLVAALWYFSGTAIGYRVLFEALRNLIPLVACIAVGTLMATPAMPMRQTLFTVTAAMVLCSLVQYPYAYGTYFFYAAPLMVVAVLYAVVCQDRAHDLPPAPSGRGRKLSRGAAGFLGLKAEPGLSPLCESSPARFGRPVLGGLLALAVLFAVFRLPQPDPRLMNGFYEPHLPTAPLRLARCGLTVYADDARVYRQLIEVIRRRTRPNDYIFATPDCPEVYFLSGRRNPTRTLYEIFAPRARLQAGSVLRCLDRHHVHLVVINCRPAFSPPPSNELLAALRRAYPRHQTFTARRRPDGPPETRFIVRWREIRPHARPLAVAPARDASHDGT